MGRDMGEGGWAAGNQRRAGAVDGITGKDG